eukprot:359309-Chlamydomonas_euryale.AAC.3
MCRSYCSTGKRVGVAPGCPQTSSAVHTRPWTCADSLACESAANWQPIGRLAAPAAERRDCCTCTAVAPPQPPKPWPPPSPLQPPPPRAALGALGSDSAVARLQPPTP